jgi:hypothetical protein
MKTNSLRLALPLVALSLASRADAQNYGTNNVVVETFAGSDFSGHYDGQGTQTMFVNPWYIVSDSAGNLYVLEAVTPFGTSGGYTGIRKITPDATVTTFVGGGTGSLPGYGTNISLGFCSWVAPLAMDRSNAIWAVLDGGAWRTRLLRARSDAYVSFAEQELSGVCRPGGVSVDSRNNLYISDPGAQKMFVYRTNGVLEWFAGSGNQGAADGNGAFTSFSGPAALAADDGDNIYVWDSWNGVIRRINQNRDVVTIAGRLGGGPDSDGFGTNASFNSVSAMCVDSSGSLILACGSSIRKMTPSGSVTTIAGSFTQGGYTNGPGPLSRFSGAHGVCVSQGRIFVADSGNHRIRSITYVPAPVIDAPPQPQTSCLGQSATFQVTAYGDQPLSYQWWSLAGPLPGQTSTNLMLTNLLSSQAGAYWVVVSNAFGSVTSAPAPLVVNDACVDLRMYAGLDIAGQAGRAYVLSYANDVNSPNWIALATNTLGASNWFYLDMDTPFQPRRFYKVNLKP